MADYLQGKTPVSLLHEMCTRKNITPKYELLQVEGAVHEPIFQYRLSLVYNGAEYEETGTGRSKKEAKHNTARAMLKALNVTAKDIIGPNKVAERNITWEEMNAYSDGDLGGNPVGVLQELCMKMKLPPPSYEVYSEEGLPHERLFAIACRVGDGHIQIGRGKSKKLAKRTAAHLMAEYLKALPVESATHQVSIEDDEEIAKILTKRLVEEKSNEAEEEAMNYTRTGRRKQKKISIFEKINSVHRKYAKWEGPKIEELELEADADPSDPYQFISDLAVEHHFKDMVIEVEEKSLKDLYQCFIQLSLDDPAVFWGQASTPEEAKIRAAKQAVQYFKLVVKSSKVLKVAGESDVEEENLKDDDMLSESGIAELEDDED